MSTSPFAYRYGLYARKSELERSETVRSIEDQKSIWLELAARDQLSIAKVYEENQSARLPGTRPVFQQLLGDLRRGSIEAVLVWNINRLTRNMEEAGMLAQMLIDGVIKEIRTPYHIYSPADNILPLLLEHGTATQFSRDLSRTVVLTQQQMVKAGGWPHLAQIGYLNARDPKNGRRGIIVPDPERFPLVRRGMDLMLTGNYTMTQVVDAMNGWGLRTRATDTKASQPLAYCRGYALFADPFYAGFIRYKGSLYTGNHLAMITPTEFGRIQEVRERRIRRRKSKRSFTYSAVIHCGVCGMQVVGEFKERNGHTYVYYHCSDPYNRCTRRSITEEALEQELAQALARISLDRELADLALAELLAILERSAAFVSNAQETQQARLNTIERERERLLGLVLDGTLSDQALYRAQDERLLAERNALLLSQTEQNEWRATVERNCRAIIAFASRSAVEFKTAEPERKRAIVAALGSYTLRDGKLRLSVHPLLEKVVFFTHKKSRSLEPVNRASGSGKRPRFLKQISSGGPESDELESNRLLMDELGKGHFPDLYPESPMEVEA